ncbi:TonB-dependent receptor [Acidobacteria bacterium AH-259-G07]|nr:TonB-dependent receptor [Acidobacteria bacterium AH-259-G07]
MRIRNLVYDSLASVCLLAFLVPATCLGQTFEATITGIITDTTGAILPGVEITATNQETNVQSTALSGDAGYYTIVGLSPGLYRVEAEMPGFKKYVQSDIRLGVNQVGRIDIELEIGLITEEVQVIGEAPILHTESAEKGSVIYNEEIIDLPLEGREFYELVFLTVGVIPEQEGGQGGFASVNGARLDSVNYVIDGGNNNILRGGDAVVRPSLDSVQEFKVQTSNYSSEYGRRSTAVVNAVLKGGTNDFHGLLFHFHRNDVFDSRNFFDIQDLDGDGELDKSKLIRNNFGGNIGGPIIQDKMFFFFNYEGMRRRDGQTRLGTVPTLGMRQGIFPAKDPITGKKITVRDPLGKKKKGKFPKFKKNIIPQDRFHPTSVAMLEFIPLPNIDRFPFNFAANRVDADDWNDFTGKFDWHISDMDNFSARYIFNDRVQDQPFHGSIFPAYGRTGDQHFQLFGMTYTRTFSPNFINQTLFNFSRKNNNRFSPNKDTDFCAVFNIGGCTQNPEFFGFPRINIRDVSVFGDGNATPLDWTENDYHINNAITVIKGQHNLRFGGEMIRTQFFQLYQNTSRGVFNFRGRGKERTSHAVGDFLLGMLDRSRRRLKTTTNYLFNTTYAGFFQDDWKVTPNLTLNFGLRYDLFIPPHDKFGNWSNFDPALGKLVISGEPGSVEIPEEQLATSIFGGSNYPRSLVWADKNNFGPRVGFAWRPFSSRTVIRAGIGQFFGLTVINPVRLSLGGNPPFTILETHRRNKKDPLYLTWDNAFPGVSVIDGITTPEAYEMRAPSANLFQYNFTIEQQFMRDVVAEVAYVGSKGTHLGRRYNLNQPSFVVDASGETVARRTYSEFGGIRLYGFDADSNYNAFQVSVRKRGRGTNWRINYSLSKSIDDASRLSGGGGANGSIFPGVQDIFNRDAERALSDFDRRHALVGSIIYRFPFKNHVLTRGWQINSIVRLYSGTPISPRDSQADIFDGEATRPDRIGTGKLDNPTPERWFNLEDFPVVPEGSFRWGTAGRNVVTGPARKHWSFSLFRTFRMPKEGHRLQFRWEIFNVPNFVNFRAVDERIDRPTAAAISQARAAREMQVALKYIF